MRILENNVRFDDDNEDAIELLLLHLYGVSLTKHVPSYSGRPCSNVSVSTESGITMTEKELYTPTREYLAKYPKERRMIFLQNYRKNHDLDPRVSSHFCKELRLYLSAYVLAHKYMILDLR